MKKVIVKPGGRAVKGLDMFIELGGPWEGGHHLSETPDELSGGIQRTGGILVHSEGHAESMGGSPLGRAAPASTRVSTPGSEAQPSAMGGVE